MTEPLTKLRGAPVDVDVRRAARVIVVILLTALAALVVSLFIADAHTNGEITSLQRHGVPVEVTVTGCNALLGGSGSNAAGYRCRGSYELDGHRYQETLPDDSPYAIGTKVKVIAAENDPGLIATAQQVRSARASWSAFVLPTVLLIVLIAALLAIVLRRRNREDQTSSD
jgi:di/tricarboxylate transporter